MEIFDRSLDDEIVPCSVRFNRSVVIGIGPVPCEAGEKESENQQAPSNKLHAPLGRPLPTYLNEGKSNGNKNKPHSRELPLTGIVGDFEYGYISHRCGDCNAKLLPLAQIEFRIVTSGVAQSHFFREKLLCATPRPAIIASMADCVAVLFNVFRIASNAGEGVGGQQRAIDGQPAGGLRRVVDHAGVIMHA